MSPLKLSYLPLSFYLFLVGLAYFLSLTVGGIFTGFFVFLFFFLVLDLLQMAVTASGISLGEEFSTEHPVRGETVTYEFRLEAQKYLLWSSRMDLKFTFDREKTTLWLGRRGRWRREMPFPCRHRGVYTLGLESLEIRSWTGWIIWSLELWPRTFYVMPRIHSFQTPPWVPEQGQTGSQSQGLTRGDPVIFDHTEPYREGIPLRYLDWKPLAQGRNPSVRRFLPEDSHGVTVFLDLWKESSDLPERTEDSLEAEDLCLEAAASLLAYLTASGIPVRCSTWLGTAEGLRHQSDLMDWLESTVSWVFQPCPSLAELWKAQGTSSPNGGLFFISHRPDPALWDLLSTLPGDRGLLAVSQFWTPDEAQSWDSHKELLRSWGCRVMEFPSAGGLEGWKDE